MALKETPSEVLCVCVSEPIVNRVDAFRQTNGKSAYEAGDQRRSRVHRCHWQPSMEIGIRRLLRRQPLMLSDLISIVCLNRWLAGPVAIGHRGVNESCFRR